MDGKACTLAVGTQTFHFDRHCDFSKLKLREKVLVSYTKTGWMLQARELKPL